jgi:hypothetical protein
MEKLRLDRKSLRKFGITMGLAILVITAVILIRHRHSPLPTAIIAAVFFIAAFVLPAALKPIYIFWMRLAFVLGFLNTRLILIIIFYAVFTPVGLILRLFRIDHLERKFLPRESYWKKKESAARPVADYQRQF